MLNRYLTLLPFLLWPELASAQASNNPEPFGLWVQELRAQAEAEGISKPTLDAALQDLSPIEQVIALDRKQPESTLTFAQYMQKVVPTARINKAQALYLENKEILEDIAARYHVQAGYIVALWGIESDFGERQGTYEIIPALATLAYDGRRSEFFRTELLKALHIVDQGHIGIHEMTGSWAGAMGQNQFMPSSFLNFAVDEDGDGKKDIWSNERDVFASIANYLHQEGWDDSKQWGWKVELPKNFSTANISIKQEKSLREWKRLGLKTENGHLTDSGEMASLIGVNTNDSAPYYLVTKNYKVILKWNRSRYFATAVGTLANAVGARP